MHALLIALGLFTLLLVAVHVIGGGRQCLRPMRDASFDPVARATMVVVWHAITAQLLLTGGLLLAVGLGAWPDTRALLVDAVSVLHLAYAGLFVAVAWQVRNSIPRAWLALGQWMFFLPLGVLGLCAT